MKYQATYYVDKLTTVDNGCSKKTTATLQSLRRPTDNPFFPYTIEFAVPEGTVVGQHIKVEMEIL